MDRQTDDGRGQTDGQTDRRRTDGRQAHRYIPGTFQSRNKKLKTFLANVLPDAPVSRIVLPVHCQM